MVHLMSIVKVIDNSGAREARCIKILKPKGKKYAEVGDLILVSIQTALASAGDINRGEIFKGLVVRTKKALKTSKDPKLMKASDNAIILVKEAAKTGELTPLASRIKGPVSINLKESELASERNKKVISLAKIII